MQHWGFSTEKSYRKESFYCYAKRLKALERNFSFHFSCCIVNVKRNYREAKAFSLFGENVAQGWCIVAQLLAIINTHRKQAFWIWNQHVIENVLNISLPYNYPCNSPFWVLSCLTFAVVFPGAYSASPPIRSALQSQFPQKTIDWTAKSKVSHSTGYIHLEVGYPHLAPLFK